MKARAVSSAGGGWLKAGAVSSAGCSWLMAWGWADRARCLGTWRELDGRGSGGSCRACSWPGGWDWTGPGICSGMEGKDAMTRPVLLLLSLCMSYIGCCFSSSVSEGRERARRREAVAWSSTSFVLGGWPGGWVWTGPRTRPCREEGPGGGGVGSSTQVGGPSLAESRGKLEGARVGAATLFSQALVASSRASWVASRRASWMTTWG